MNDNDYAIRISNATPSQLNIITFEICIENIREAIENYDIDSKIYYKRLDTSILALKEIILSLDHEYEISRELYNIYVYVNKILITSKFKENIKDLESAIIILNSVMEGFIEIDKLDDSKESVMQNATKVFAGLTYGKEGLSEYIESTENRGFKA